MAIWKWERNSWMNISLFCSLTIIVAIYFGSIGIRSSFSAVQLKFRFYQAYYPEIGITNFLLYVAASCGFGCVLLRRTYVSDKNQVAQRKIITLNDIAAYPGYFSFLGLVLVASFSVTPDQSSILIHTIGFYVFVGLGLIFALLQVILTHMVSKNSKSFIMRLILVLLLASVIISSIALTALNTGNEIFPVGKNRSAPFVFTPVDGKKTPDEQKYELNNQQVIAWSLELASIFVYALFFLTFVKGFSKISIYIIFRPYILPTLFELQNAAAEEARIQV